MVRSPTEVVRSAYLYHKQIPVVESWLKDPITVPRGIPVPDPHQDESLNQYLNRVSLRDGLLAEMSTVSMDTLAQMDAAYTGNLNNSRVMTMCLEKSFHHFDELVTSISGFLGVSLTPELATCVAKLNPEKRTFGSHSTSGTISDAEEEEILSYIEELDHDYMDHRFRTSPLYSLCAHQKAEAQRQWMDLIS